MTSHHRPFAGKTRHISTTSKALLASFSSLPEGVLLAYRVSASVSSSALVENVKAAQSVEVSQRIIDEGLVHTSLVLKEVDWFFNRMYVGRPVSLSHKP